MNDKVSPTLLQRQYSKKMEELVTQQKELVDFMRDRRISPSDTEVMNEPHDYRHELSLRDEQLRRELDLRDKSFRAEQATRDKALDEKFSGFLAAQTERDNAWEKISDSRFERIERDVSGIKLDTKKVTEDVHVIRRWIATYTGGIAVLTFIVGIAIRHFWA
ncbi:hypothetical protein [Pseudomonas coronafaciens]|uniref:Uncharacterized protein n=1 Tax=Pseudomonas coronafaciens pv. coronafaciens TaxID=235275 RepID=A0AAE6ULC8_9PSED|nr:hypothetical protein [Pseudomonas coronafaciens]QGT81567.1 hypothetical protein GMO17_10380 [Pseudomonas coronafaciens pv. coronafaciens]